MFKNVWFFWCVLHKNGRLIRNPQKCYHLMSLCFSFVCYSQPKCYNKYHSKAVSVFVVIHGINGSRSEFKKPNLHNDNSFNNNID